MNGPDLSSVRVTWLVVGIAYGVCIGVLAGRRLQVWSEGQAQLRARVWELEARERERQREAERQTEAAKGREPSRPD